MKLRKRSSDLISNNLVLKNKNPILKYSEAKQKLNYSFRKRNSQINYNEFDNHNAKSEISQNDSLSSTKSTSTYALRSIKVDTKSNSKNTKFSKIVLKKQTKIAQKCQVRIDRLNIRMLKRGNIFFKCFLKIVLSMKHFYLEYDYSK